MNKYVVAVFSAVLCTGFVGCNSDKTPVPFKAKVAGIQVAFPIKAGKLMKDGYTLASRFGSQYRDTTASTLVAWLTNEYEGGDDILKGLPDPRSAYGVNIYLKHKGYRLDSVRTALEQQFGKQFEPVQTTHLRGLWSIDKAGYKLVINPSTTLFLRRATDFQGDPWGQYDTLRIAIGYNLSEEQQDHFAINAVRIEEDD